MIDDLIGRFISNNPALAAIREALFPNVARSRLHEGRVEAPSDRLPRFRPAQSIRHSPKHRLAVPAPVLAL